MRSVRILGAAILATTGLIAVGVTTQAANAVGSKNLTASYTKVMKSEEFVLRGGLSTPVVRTVKLQYRNQNSGGWTTKLSTSSNASGRFAFFPSSKKTRYWRYYAPATDSLGSIKGNSIKISVVAQKVQSIDVVRHTQCHFGSSATENVTVVYDFYPSRPGRIVGFSSSSIDTSGAEDVSGKVQFTFNPGTTDGTFDAVGTAQAIAGASSLVSKKVHYSITQCQLIRSPDRIACRRRGTRRRQVISIRQTDPSDGSSFRAVNEGDVMRTARLLSAAILAVTGLVAVGANTQPLTRQARRISS